MINEIGNGLQISAAFFSISTILVSNIKIKKLTSYLSSILIIVSFLLLVVGFIVSDFSVLNVFLNSSTIKPLIFRISGAWASHEGSIMLWLSLLCLVDIISTMRSTEEIMVSKQIILLSIIKLLFIIFIYFTSNPFTKINILPKEGLGLNPTLQDIALFIHPPILYFGYVCLVIPFINAIVACSVPINLIKLSLLKSSRFFTGLSLIFTTSGISVGSWWAYRELGWGGYWFFDPVENISLLPWLAGIALYHSVQVSIKKDKLLIWTWFFSIMAFWLVIFGTVLVRAGILVSVHSFAASKERAIYLFVILSMMTLVSAMTLIWHYRRRIFEISLSYNQIGIKGGNILWLINIIILILSIIYPLYAMIDYESPSLDTQFFLTSFIPIIIITLFVAGIFMVNKNTASIFIMIITSLITTIICYFVRCSYISIAAILASSYLTFQSTYLLFAKNYINSRKSSSFIAMIISHLGCGLLALSITLNCATQNELEFSGKVGESKNFDQFNVLLKDIKFAEAENYYRQIAEFWISDTNNNTVTVIKPENRYYKIEKSLSQESDIYSYLTHDIYGILSRIEDEIVTAKIYYRPMMSFIWLSLMVIVGGLLISQFSKVHAVTN